MQFLFDISHLVLIRMNASLYKGRHVHTSTYTLLPVDSSKSGNLFFFFHAKSSYIFFLSRWALADSIPFFPSIFLGIHPSQWNRRGEKSGAEERRQRRHHRPLLRHSLWENGGKAGWLVSNEFAGRVLSMYPWVAVSGEYVSGPWPRKRRVSIVTSESTLGASLPFPFL